MHEELKVQITETQERLVAAIEADDPYEVARHRARLQDLIDMASRHGVDARCLGESDLAAQLKPARRVDQFGFAAVCGAARR